MTDNDYRIVLPKSVIDSRFLSFGNSGKSLRGFAPTPASILVPQLRQQEELVLPPPPPPFRRTSVVVEEEAVDVATSRFDFGLQGRKGV